MVTYNNIIDYFKLFANNHFFIQTFSHGNIEEADLAKYNNYPIMHVNYTGSSYDEVQNYNFEVYVLGLPPDKLDKISFQTEVISDSKQCLEDLISDIKLGENIFTLNEGFDLVSASMTPLEEETKNVLSGMVLDLSFQVPFTYDTCDAPLTGVTPTPSGECLPVRVTNSTLSYDVNVQPGETLVLSDNTVTDVDGTTRDVPAQTDVVCSWTTFNVVNSVDDVLATVSSYPSGGVEISDIEVTDVDSTTRNVPVGDVVCEWTTIRLRNSDASYVNVLSDYPVGAVVNLPDITLTEVDGTTSAEPSNIDLVCEWKDVVVKNQDGDTLGTIESYPSGGEFEVTTSGGGATGIVYQRPQWEGQITSFADGDVGYSAANGAYNYNETGDVAARLDYSSADPFYTLINDNAFGNKFRFTTDIGAGASDGKAEFITSDFTGANQSGYVIDHLTGLGYMQGKVSFGDDWATGMATVFTFSNFYTGWRAISMAEINTVVNDNFNYYAAGNIFRRTEGVSGSDTSMYLGNTDMIVSNTNAFRLLDTCDFRRVSKAFSSSIGFYVVRNHY